MIGMSKKSLAITLSRLQGFTSANPALEQYLTESSLAADLLWDAHLRGELDGSAVVDLGAGTGVLGLGAALLGARVVLVEKDAQAAAVCRENAAALGLKVRIVIADVEEYSGRADLVVMNPPFGTRARHADRRFLSVAFALAPIVYSFHKTSTDRFVRAFSRDEGFAITAAVPVSFPLRNTMRHHRKEREFIAVTRYRFEKIYND